MDDSKQGCQRQGAIIFMTAWDSDNNRTTAETSATAGPTVTAETIALGASSSSSINTSIWKDASSNRIKARIWKNQQQQHKMQAWKDVSSSSINASIWKDASSNEGVSSSKDVNRCKDTQEAIEKRRKVVKKTQKPLQKTIILSSADFGQSRHVSNIASLIQCMFDTNNNSESFFLVDSIDVSKLL